MLVGIYGLGGGGSALRRDSVVVDVGIFYRRMDIYADSVVVITCEVFLRWEKGCVEARTLLDTFCGSGIMV